MEEIEGRLFWDAECEMADQLLDLPPDAACQRLDDYGNDPDYFVAISPDPDPAGLEAARRRLSELTERGRHAR